MYIKSLLHAKFLHRKATGLERYWQVKTLGYISAILARDSRQSHHCLTGMMVLFRHKDKLVQCHRGNCYIMACEEDLPFFNRYSKLILCVRFSIHTCIFGQDSADSHTFLSQKVFSVHKCTFLCL